MKTEQSFLAIAVSRSPERSEGDSEAIKARVRRTEQLLRQVYEENNLQQLDWETEIDAAVLGDACYKVTWDADKKHIREGTS